MFELRFAIRAIWITIAALAVLHLLTQGAAEAGLIGEDARSALIFNMDSEASVPTWFAMSLLLLIGLAQIVLYLVLRAGGVTPRRGWLVFGLVFLYLSLDEGAALHERLTVVTRTALGVTSGPLYYAWVVPYVLALLLLTPVAVRFLLRLPRRTRTLMIVATALYVGGAVGMELISGAVVGDGEESAYAGTVWILNGIEETLELSGAAVYATAIGAHYRAFVQPPEGVRLVVA